MRVEQHTEQAAASLLSARAGFSSVPALRTAAGEHAGPRQVQQTQRLHDGVERKRKTGAVPIEEQRRRTGTRMRVDEATSRIVGQLIDQNNKVIRQVPPQELLEIAAQFRRLQGLIFDERA